MINKIKKKEKNKLVKSDIIYINDEPTTYVIYEDTTIINTKTSHIMKPQIKKFTGRVIVRLTHKGIRKEYQLSRLMAVSFIPNPENKSFVHHIDRNVMNNLPDNLQWVTESEHISIHSNDDSHPFAKGENHSRSTLTDEQVHIICKLIQGNKKSQREISKMFNVPEYIIHEIRLKHNWKHITCKYDFTNYTAGSIAMKEKDVKKVCRMISKNKATLPEIANKIGVEYGSVLNIYNKKIFVNISNNYDFSKFTKHMRYPEKMHNDIKRLMLSGKSNKEIIKILNLERCPKTNTFLYRERRKIN